MQPPSSLIIEQLIPYFDSLGYKFLKSQNKFKKDVDKDKEFIFSIVFDGRGGLCQILYFFWGVNFKKLSKAEKSIMGFDYGYTIGTMSHYIKDFSNIALCDDSLYSLTLSEISKIPFHIKYPTEKIEMISNKIKTTFSNEVNEYYSFYDSYEKILKAYEYGYSQNNPFSYGPNPYNYIRIKLTGRILNIDVSEILNKYLDFDKGVVKGSYNFQIINEKIDNYRI